MSYNPDHNTGVHMITTQGSIWRLWQLSMGTLGKKWAYVRTYTVIQNTSLTQPQPENSWCFFNTPESPSSPFSPRHTSLSLSSCSSLPGKWGRLWGWRHQWRGPGLRRKLLVEWWVCLARVSARGQNKGETMLWHTHRGEAVATPSPRFHIS